MSFLETLFIKRWGISWILILAIALSLLSVGVALARWAGGPV